MTITTEEKTKLDELMTRIVDARSNESDAARRLCEAQEEVENAKAAYSEFFASVHASDAPPAKRAYNRKPKSAPTSFEVMAGARNAAVGE